ncbi:MAG: hypothetical protein ACOCZ7_01525, partial [Armatimonadota bacterium]
MTRVTFVPLAVIFMAAAHAADLPNPFAPPDGPVVGPGPVPVMEQAFYVEAPIAPATEVDVTAPEGVILLDRTKPGYPTERTRFYFRADRGLEGEIVLTPAGGEAMHVPLTVRSYREDIEHQVQQVPGVQSDERKRGRSYYTDRMIATARENMEAHPELADEIDRDTRYDAMSDEEIFQALPGWNVPRQCYSNWPCPDCGEVIFKRSGFYPWQASTGDPWKLTCPECGRKFPSNDWANGDFTSGDYPDDGWGYPLTGTERSDYAGWIAYYNHHQLWRQVGGELRRLSLRYLLFGDEEAAHRAGILLARIAYIYPGMNMRW